MDQAYVEEQIALLEADLASGDHEEGGLAGPGGLGEAMAELRRANAAEWDRRELLALDLIADAARGGWRDLEAKGRSALARLRALRRGWEGGGG